MAVRVARARGGGIMRVPVAMVAATTVVAASEAGARVTLTASRPDALYATDTEIECGELARLTDAELSSNVVRIRAEDDTGCRLDKETIGSYRHSSILWIAPTCDALPSNTSRQFGGDTVKVRVKADGQRGRVAKATLDVGYDRLGTPILTVSDTRLQPDDGLDSKLVETLPITTVDHFKIRGRPVE